MLHILPHWNWEGREGQEIEVWAYCNQDSVELFLDGTSLGSQPVKKNGHLVWKVKYTPGTLLAQASKDGKVVLTDKRQTAGPATKVLATADQTKIAADGQDVAVINVAIVDEQDNLAPNANHKVTWSVTGPGSVIGVGNGDPSCHEPWTGLPSAARSMGSAWRWCRASALRPVRLWLLCRQTGCGRRP